MLEVRPLKKVRKYIYMMKPTSAISSVDASSCEQNQQKKLAALPVKSMSENQSMGVQEHEGASGRNTV